MKLNSRRTLQTLCMICFLVSKAEPRGFFIHSAIVNGKPKVVATAVNDTLESVAPKTTSGVSKSAKFEIPLTPTDQEWLGSLIYLPEGQDTRLRKEYRELSEKERQDLHLAFNLLKNDTSVTFNKYDLLANIHARSSANANAHNGPSFLGWHRVFLMMMENALREKIKNVTMPYWDVTLDEAMEKPYNSIMWSDEFMGSGDGAVRKGAFNFWETQFGYGHLKRFLAGQGKLMSTESIEKILSKRRLGDITNPSAEKEYNIENIHNDVHVWIGGQMKTIEIAAFDPIFYLFHAFVDNIWTEFREQQISDGIDPSSDYPEFYGLSTHSPFAPMALGRVMVLDGISNIWSKNVTYSQRPFCNQTYNGCESPYIKCDISKRKCISKTVHEVLKENSSLNTNLEREPFSSRKEHQSKDEYPDETIEIIIENLYLSKIRLKKSKLSMYNSFSKSEGTTHLKIVEMTTTSDVYQFYSNITGAHREFTNLSLFLLYLLEFYYKGEYK